MIHSNQHDSRLEVVHALRHIPHDAEGRTAHFAFSTKQQLKKTRFWRAQPAESTVNVAIFAEDVGRSQDGAAACQLVIDQIYAAISETKDKPLAARLAQSLHRANMELCARAQSDMQLADARISIVVVATVNGELRLAHLGNSRAYLIRNGEVHLLTIDHTKTQEMISRGLLFLTDAKNSTSYEEVTRYLGLDEEIEVDHNILPPHDSNASADTLLLPRLLEHLTLQPHDIVALCSNGISDTLTEDEIAEAIAETDLAGVADRKTNVVAAASSSAALTKAAQRLVQAVADTATTDADPVVEAAALLLRLSPLDTAVRDENDVSLGWVVVAATILLTALMMLALRLYQLWSIIAAGL